MPALPFAQVISKTLLQRFAHEAGLEEGDETRFYGALLREDGHLFVHHPESQPLDEAQLIWSGRILRLLNKELHHDGAWVVCWTHPRALGAKEIGGRTRYYCRYCLIFVDKDGDPQFTQEWSHGNGDMYDFVDVVLAGIESTAQKCEASWQTWHMLMRKVLEPKSGQTYKRAKGERAPSLQ